ncbi:hypothetical protein EAI_04421 [Harpegnathos saltator]|uniref:Uncharacterized protein n=1 Tax=Harpegnathos saltator TaxID=610380 RepID=E2BBG5_HARSA|nr:hypothetical protein EAI_04421 [Harpegnathos saltator]
MYRELYSKPQSESTRITADGAGTPVEEQTGLDWLAAPSKLKRVITMEAMDNSAYVPNHLPPPSLVVFSQPGTLPEALRMQRPFNPQVTDSKDLQVPFSTAASLGYGLHHMLHLPPQFLHPLDHRLPFGGFRPLVPSAFAPPSKCLKVETGNGAVPGNGGLPSIGSLTSMSNMFSPTSLPGAGGGAVISECVVRANAGGKYSRMNTNM